MTARDIQRRLIWARYAKGFAIPNYTPPGWFECDVFEISKAGFFREYEIKLTISDFVADTRKRRSDPIYVNGVYTGTGGGNKHEMLRERALKGPSRFYYVTPKGLLKYDQIPAWAGWMEIEYFEDSSWPWSYCPSVVKEAPQLHRSKVREEVRAHAQSVCYWRFIKLFLDRQTPAVAESEQTNVEADE